MADEKPGPGSVTLILLVLSCATLYFGGWSVVWNGSLGEGIDTGRFWYQQSPPRNILLKRGVRFRVNEGYYGFVYGPRFFDSPVLSWIAICIGGTLLGAAFQDEST